MAVVKEYQSRDARIKCMQNIGERGVVTNFMSAVTHCRGDVIFLCDQDDVWYRDKVEKHIKAYQDSSIMWVYNEVRLTDENLRPIGLLTDTMPDYWTRRNFLYYTWGSCVLGCATSYRSHLLKDIWPADSLAPGHDSWIQLAIYPAKSYYIPEILQEYRQHGNNAVGMQSPETLASEENKQRAVKGNIMYVKNLSRNQRLHFWKRIFLSAIYVAKIIRSKLI